MGAVEKDNLGKGAQRDVFVRGRCRVRLYFMYVEVEQDLKFIQFSSYLCVFVHAPVCLTVCLFVC